MADIATEWLGHDAAERVLLDGLANGRLAHAWLLAGPRGIGKATLAHRFAARVLGGDQATTNQIAVGSHPGLLTLKRQINRETGKPRADIAVDDVREAGHFLRLTSAGMRVVIVDSADDLNANSANALLKILEEPPENALLLLIAHAPGRLLATIRSRCRVLVMRPLSDGNLDRLLTLKRPELSAAERAELGRLAGGSIGRALELAELSGMETQSELRNLLAALPRLDMVAVHQFADHFAAGEDAAAGLRTAMEMLGAWTHDQAALAAREHRAGPWIGAWERVGELARRGEALGLDRRMVLIDAFLAIEAASRGVLRPLSA